MTRPAKICASCGRRFEWRRRWKSCWDEVRYCSSACRRRRVSPVDHRLEEGILGLLERRDRSSSICPSEAARQVAPEDWRELMESTRRAARRLAAAGRLEFVQRGRAVDPSAARGPIRLRRIPG
jgi:hypothetical protein